jgi:zinc protease
MSRRVFAWLVLFPLATLSTRAAEPKIPELPVEAYKLPNGLKVILSRDPTVPRVTVTVAYHVGSKNERAGRTGFAHFFEHMMFRGTKNVPNYDIPLKETGAQSNAFTSEDMTVYFETVPSNYLERALYLEAERLAFLPSALNQEKFDTEREVVKNERRQSMENVPYGLAEETLLANVFPEGHPYSWSVIGSMRDLDSASLKDLKRFFGEFYHPGNATLCLVGDFDPQEAKAWIQKYFGPLASGPAVKPVEAPPAPPVSKQIEQADKVQLPRVYWTWPTVRDDDPDAAALDILSIILAGGDASRLHKALVLDARVASEVDASSNTHEIAGEFTIDATAAPDHKISEIEPILKKQIEEVRSAPPTDKELQRALARLEKSMYTRLTPPLGRAVTLALGFAQHDDPNYYRRDFARYFKVTLADIQRVAKKYLTPEKVVLVVRPTKPDEAESPAVLAGPKPGGAAEPAIADRTSAPGPDWSQMPVPSQPRPFHAPPIHRRKLSNGVEVWMSPWKTLPIVSAHLLMPVGTGDDPAGKSGLATLTGSLLDKGTQDKTATELAEAFELLGVTPRVGTGPDTTSVGLSVVAHNFAPALKLVGEMLTSPRFDPKDVDRERQLQLADLLQGPDDPHWIARRAFRALLYGPDHPYGNPSEGYTETVKGLTLEDIKSFHDKLAANQSVLIVVGDIEPDATVQAIEEALGVWKTKGPTPEDRPAPKVQAEPDVVFLADKPGAVQSVLDVGRIWVDRDDPRYFATVIGNRILGGDFLSRLNQNLREEHGYSYGAGSHFNFRRKGSVWAVSSAVRADATAPALKEVMNELDGLTKKRPFTAEEIATARDAEARSFPESFESPADIAGLLEEMALHHLPADYLDTYLDKLQATTEDQVRQAMAEVVDRSVRTTLVVGDRKTVEPQLKEQGFHTIRAVTPDGRPAGP